MHESNLVIIPKPGSEDNEDSTVDTLVEAAMGPSRENGGFWDWFRIGGHWTGILDGYDPKQDPENIQTCRLCAGTGKRMDKVAEALPHLKDKCNGCNGTGKSVKWPAEWKRHDGDIVPVPSLTAEHLSKFYRIVLPDGESFVKEKMLEWIRRRWGVDHLAVVVDTHS